MKPSGMAAGRSRASSLSVRLGSSLPPYARSGQYHWRRGESDEADVCLRRAEEIARHVGARDIQAEAMQDLGVNQSLSGREGEALATLEEAFRLAKEVGDRINLQRMYNNYASTLAVYGSEFVRARAVAAEGVELGRRIGGVGWLAWIVGTLGEIDLAIGDLARAEELTREALALAIEARDEPLMSLRYPILAHVVLLRGRVGEAEEAMARAHELLGEDEEPQGEIPRSLTEAMLASARRSQDEALTHLRHGVELSERFSVDQLPQLFTELVRELVSRGALDEARAVRASLDRGLSPVSRACAATVAHGLLATTTTWRWPSSPRRSSGSRRCWGQRNLLGARPHRPRAGAAAGGARLHAPPFEEGRDLLVACDARSSCPRPSRTVAKPDDQRSVREQGD